MSEPSVSITSFDSTRDLSDISQSEESDDQLIIGGREDLISDSRIKLWLFISHSLSTWNSRVFEFGAVLFLAEIFANTLLPVSVYALLRAASATCFSPVLGSYIDRKDRLALGRASILGQRVSVIGSCVLFGLMTTGMASHKILKIALLIFLCLLACVEKLSSTVNLIAIERDWVVVIAESTELELQALNSQMRRIDLACKLLGPLIIALLNGLSVKVAIDTTLALNITSVSVEYCSIAKVYRQVVALQAPKAEGSFRRQIDALTLSASLGSHLTSVYRSLTAYIHHEMFLPSIALAVTHLTVLSFSGQMVAYLLYARFSSTQIGLMRTVSVVLEMSATCFTPWAMNKVGPVRTGLWSITWQTACVIGGVTVFCTMDSVSVAAIGLVIGVILSRVGLWGFDLSVQIIVQEGVEAELRGSFSTMEAAFQNFFELWAYTSTIVFARPQSFRYPASMSITAVFVAGALYTGYVRHRRGHLLHLSTYMTSVRKRLTKRPEHNSYISMRDIERAGGAPGNASDGLG